MVDRAEFPFEEERPPSARLPSKRVTVLHVYGHLFYAAARTLEKLLPSARGAERPVAILRFRGRTVLGATLIDILSNYARDLHAANGRLYLSGLSESVHREVAHSGKLQLAGPVPAYLASRRIDPSGIGTCNGVGCQFRFER